MQSTNKIIPKHPWHDCRCGFKGRFNSNVCPLSMCTPAGDGILHSPIVGDLISDSKPTVPEPEFWPEPQQELEPMGRHSDAASFQRFSQHKNEPTTHLRSKDMWGFEGQLGNAEQVLRDGNVEVLRDGNNVPCGNVEQFQKPTAIDQRGQQTSLQKMPQGQQLN